MSAIDNKITPLFEKHYSHLNLLRDYTGEYHDLRTRLRFRAVKFGYIMRLNEEE